MSKTTNSNDELDYELQRLQAKVSELEGTISRLKKVITENDLDDEIEDVQFVSVEEQICVDGINHLAVLFKNGQFTKDETQMLDVLHKNLRLIRGLAVPTNGKAKSAKKEDVGKLLEIVNGTKK